MPHLLLLRHAKAESSGKGGGLDHDRTLSGRGKRDAVAMGPVVAAHGRPEIVLCSTSTRTRETWEGVRAALPTPPDPRFLADLYEGGADYLDIVRREGATADTLLVIGHNPTIQSTAAELAGQANSARLREFPTAALAIFEIDGSWAGLDAGSARLIELFLPAGSTR